MGFPAITDSRFSRSDWAREFFGETEMASATRRGSKKLEQTTAQKKAGEAWGRGFVISPDKPKSQVESNDDL
ncbi:hypothetical protein [Paraburkholderia caribensis]|uniref:hypothetical protein n=1 Tax=Paraburkholderia caribensis TaxID=75105 RepID=UPI001CACA9B2|nr:hypothetical protein [Paraburkholderia caribensis]CAG9249990.1 hypothetical protein PCAR4_260096 [Paraburkholderia caribensis]